MTESGTAGTWILSKDTDAKFPYRIQIVGRDGRSLTLRAQDRWPAANRNIFCLRENETEAKSLDEIERVPIVALQRRGVRLSVVLDRER